MASSQNNHASSPRSTTHISVSAVVTAAAVAVAKKHPHLDWNRIEKNKTPSEGNTDKNPLLSARKRQIVALSMAAIGQQLDSWLESDYSTKRGVKRGRSESISGGVVVGVVAAEKKRAKREPGGKKLACPFARREPVKYATVKTCCGPGWDNVHRIKEHLYRKHSLENACNRCFKFFDDAQELRDHQRSATPCRLSDDPPRDVITDDQEEKLRKRAKANAPEVEKWEIMYKILFPGEKIVPSPYYDAPTLPPSPAVMTPRKSSPTTLTTTANISAVSPAQSKDLNVGPDPDDLAECKANFRRDLLRAVEPILEAEVERALMSVQNKVLRKAHEIVYEVGSRLARTWKYSAEQQQQVLQVPVYAEPTPGPEPDEEELPVAEAAGESGGAPVDDWTLVVDTLQNSEMFSFLMPPDGVFPFESFLHSGEQPGSEGGECGVLGSAMSTKDSAYYTGLGSESWAGED